MADTAPDPESRARVVALVLAGTVSQAIRTAVELGPPAALAAGSQGDSDALRRPDSDRGGARLTRA
jgi:hypothetical protein